MRWPFYFFMLPVFFACRQVQTIRPRQSAIVEAVYASGKIVADGEYTAYALNGGTITKKCVKDGMVVKKGQILYEIEAEVPAARADAARSTYLNVQNNLSSQSRILNDAKLSLQSAQAKYRNDSLQYHRLQSLFEKGIGMRSTVDNAYTAYLVSRNSERAVAEKYNATVNDLQVSLQNARSGFTAAQADLRNASIRSNVNGTVYQTWKEAGEAVRPNEAVALIGSSEKRIIRLAV
ncbi:MAG TPA: hypothetical protein VM010_04250, partial [Chitinophagaceae bacterium]|nr:hypothetical protein [Chitinophagaceae bacterium]